VPYVQDHSEPPIIGTPIPVLRAKAKQATGAEKEEWMLRRCAPRNDETYSPR